MDQPPTYVSISEFVAVCDERDRWARMYWDLVSEFQLYKQTHSAQNQHITNDSHLFTKKAKIERKETQIIASLQASMQRRRDKARALIEAVRYWQDGGYIDRYYNAQTMYEELRTLIPLPFSAANFRKFYNQWSSVAF